MHRTPLFARAQGCMHASRLAASRLTVMCRCEWHRLWCGWGAAVTGPAGNRMARRLRRLRCERDGGDVQRDSVLA